jgi:hypothetical protein
MSTLIAVGKEEPRTALDRAVLILYVTSLVLLPWAWFPAFPWFHEHAEWSDPVFAATAVCWVLACWRNSRWPRLGGAHFALAGYLVTASLSFVLSSSHERAGAWKLLGIAELCGLALVTADITSRPRVMRYIGRALTVTALLVAAAAVVGLLLFYAGEKTRLVGIYGELTPSPFYARVQAGLYNPNVLASFCIFCACAIGHRDAELPCWLRRLGTGALWIAVALTFSRGIIGFAVAAAIHRANTRSRRILAASSVIAGISLMVLLTLCQLSIDPTRPFQARISRSTSSSRYQALTTSLESVIRNPIAGTGPDTHPGRYFGNAFDSHMTYVGIAATLGLPSLGFFAWLICIAWMSRGRPVELSLWGGMAGLAIDGLGQDIENFRHVWVLIGFVLGEAARANNRGVGSSPTSAGSKESQPSAAVEQRARVALIN